MTEATEEKVAEPREQEAAQADEKPAGKSAPLPAGKMAEFLDWIEGITVLELSQLVKALEERLGVSASAPAVIAAAGPGQGGGSESAAAEKTEFSVILADIGSQKIGVIKEVRAITGLGLKDSKELVESAPKAVKEGVSKEQAEEIKAKLEGAGAKVEIK